PEPVPVELLPRALPRSAESMDPPPARQSPRALLAQAAERIDYTIRPAGRRSLPRWSLPLLPLLGAAVAALAGLVGSGLVSFGSTGVPGGTVIRLVGWLAFLVA